MYEKQDKGNAIGGAVDQMRATAGHTTARASEAVKGQASSQKARAADGITKVADALRQTGQQLEQQGQAPVGTYVNRAAEQAERLAGYLQQTDIEQMIHEASDFARQQPALFLGGALVVGMVGARFLKSSGAKARTGQTGVRDYAHAYGMAEYPAPIG